MIVVLVLVRRIQPEDYVSEDDSSFKTQSFAGQSYRTRKHPKAGGTLNLLLVVIPGLTIDRFVAPLTRLRLVGTEKRL